MKIRTIAAALVSALAVAATPLDARTVEDGQAWININAQGSLKDRLLYYAEIQPRLFDGGGQIGQVIARGALGWKLSDKVSIFQGYAHIAEPNDALARDRNEERSFQQLSWNLGEVAGGRLTSRTRFEQRWRSDGDAVNLRVRSMLRYAHPIGADPKGVAILISAEPFVIVKHADWGPPTSGFDQVRTNVALEIPLQGRSTIEVGYLNQYLKQRAGLYQLNHVAQVVLALRP